MVLNLKYIWCTLEVVLLNHRLKYLAPVHGIVACRAVPGSEKPTTVQVPNSPVLIGFVESDQLCRVVEVDLVGG